MVGDRGSGYLSAAAADLVTGMGRQRPSVTVHAGSPAERATPGGR